MKPNRKFLEVARRFWPNAHGGYEEMCALAATGQLGGAQMYELNEHIATCDSCRRFLESAAQVSVQVMPLLADNRVQEADIVQPDGMRTRFLQRLAAEGVNRGGGVPRVEYRVRPRRPIPASVEAQSEVGRPVTTSADSSTSTFRMFFSMRRPAAVLVSSVVIAIVGLCVGEWRARQSPQQVMQTAPSSAATSQGNIFAAVSDRVSQVESQNIALEAEIGKLQHELSNATAEEQSLGSKLAAAKDQIVALTATMESASRRSVEEGEAAKNQVATLQVQIETLTHQLTEYDFKLGVQKQASKELAAKLETAQTELQLERDLRSPKSELGELVSARNLHIVDVYDADANGNRQRSFGRVFYIEGKSLVFYAYDLNDSRRFKANVVFHVWGGNAGAKVATYRLGILHKDDDGQSRWAMTFDDPKVLAQINSVFVTAEPGNKSYDEPHGKRVLFAYFGNPPNHQ
jgi:predicted  nucleic acid-binding Zn-ribbon protein